MIEVLGIKNADKLVPIEDDAKPTDPISENMNALMGKPLKAFIYQTTQHILQRMNIMKDPMIAQAIGKNPQAQRIMAALQAHIAEHYAFLYRQQIEKRLGASLPAPNSELPENLEVALSSLVAKAAEQVTQGNQQKAAQMQAQQKAQDPIVQMKQAGCSLKLRRYNRKDRKRCRA